MKYRTAEGMLTVSCGFCISCQCQINFEQAQSRDFIRPGKIKFMDRVNMVLEELRRLMKCQPVS